jgi:ribonuclease P protein component
MKFTYPREEKLKSQKIIELLFTSGSSVSKYPLRLVYVEIPENFEENFLFGVSVSKKYFKKATDRNYFKRVLREVYRKNQVTLKEITNKKMAYMFFYQTKDKLSYKEINEKTIQLFEKMSENFK